MKPYPIAFRKALEMASQNDNAPSVFIGNDLYEDGFGSVHDEFDIAIIMGDTKQSPSKPKSEKIIFISTPVVLLQTLKEVEKYA